MYRNHAIQHPSLALLQNHRTFILVDRMVIGTGMVLCLQFLIHLCSFAFVVAAVIHVVAVIASDWFHTFKTARINVAVTKHTTSLRVLPIPMVQTDIDGCKAVHMGWTPSSPFGSMISNCVQYFYTYLDEVKSNGDGGLQALECSEQASC